MQGDIHAIFDADRVAAHVPGTVYGIVRDGKLVFVEGLGTRDPKTGAKVDADTRFRIASMSKAFTALAILHLRDQGKLSLDAPASRYVPEMAGWKLADRRFARTLPCPTCFTTPPGWSRTTRGATGSRC